MNQEELDLTYQLGKYMKEINRELREVKETLLLELKVLEEINDKIRELKEITND